MGLSSSDYRNSMPIEGALTHTVIALQCLYTGYCGSDGTEITYFVAGEDVLQRVHEEAIEHAASYGYEGEEDEETGEWIPNENAQGCAYHFDPRYHMGYTAGGGDEAALLDVLIEAEIAVLDKDGETLYVSVEGIRLGMFGDSKENVKLVDKFIREAIKDVPSAPYGNVTQVVWS